MKTRSAISLLLFISTLTFSQDFSPLGQSDFPSNPSASRSANFVDFNGDGWDDIFFSNGPSAGQNNHAYINNQEGGFTFLTNQPIVNDAAKSDGAAFADIDNDGDLDMYVVTWYGDQNNFYTNDGNGEWTEIDNNLSDFGSYSETAAWQDFDGNGFADLFVTNSEGTSLQNKLFLNQGNLTFIAADNLSFLIESKPSRSVDWIDYDNDGDIDLFVTNEGTNKNSLFQNDNGTFNQITDSEISSDGRNSAGSSWSDIDNDGDFDLFVANYQNQNNQLFLNDGDGTFTKVEEGPIVSDGGWSFGSAFGDYDNDGDLDLFVCNAFGPGVLNFFYRNTGNGVFERLTDNAPSMDEGWTFGCAWGDLDNDGFLDLALANCKDENQRNVIYKNQGNENNWLKLKLQGTTSNASAIGAIVQLKTTINGQATWLTRRVTSQSGYNCQNSLTLHFGLSTSDQIDSIKVQWPGGNTESFAGLDVNQICEITEGVGSDCMITAINEIVENVNIFKIRPNPTIGDFIIIDSFSNDILGQSELFLSIGDGKIVRRFEKPDLIVQGTQIKLPISGLQAGLYFITIKANGFAYSKKVVVH